MSKLKVALIFAAGFIFGRLVSKPKQEVHTFEDLVKEGQTNKGDK